mmetsp:Transcript_3852/g.8846  ORF Transcript_3852/g.8846 Transcript_3852/m.8846 type:complete len:274 (-) Transcript_3852:11-832(-)
MFACFAWVDFTYSEEGEGAGNELKLVLHLRPPLLISARGDCVQPALLNSESGKRVPHEVPCLGCVFYGVISGSLVLSLGRLQKRTLLAGRHKDLLHERLGEAVHVAELFDGGLVRRQDLQGNTLERLDDVLVRHLSPFNRHLLPAERIEERVAFLGVLHRAVSRGNLGAGAAGRRREGQGERQGRLSPTETHIPLLTRALAGKGRRARTRFVARLNSDIPGRASRPRARGPQLAGPLLAAQRARASPSHYRNVHRASPLPDSPSFTATQRPPD